MGILLAAKVLVPIQADGLLASMLALTWKGSLSRTDTPTSTFQVKLPCKVLNSG